MLRTASGERTVHGPGERSGLSARFVHRLGFWSADDRARIVGIVNVTPDSFYDGGRFESPDRALARAEAMAADGADAIDVGGQSTRPGAAPPCDVETEWARVGPALERIIPRMPLPVSIDTYHAEVARRALDAGAAIVNDVSGLAMDPVLARYVAQAGAGLVLMHAIGFPDRVHAPRTYTDVARNVRDGLAISLGAALRAGVAEDRIALDPGIGFSKQAEQSIDALRGIPSLLELGRPVYVGLSRKSFLGTITRRSVEERLPASIGAAVAAYALGARIFRVHDVRETRDALSTAEAALGAG